jgi:hypothetical protein
MAFPFAIGLALAFGVTFYGLLYGFGETQILFLQCGLAPFVACGLGYIVLWVTDRRPREIRRLLGPHELGQSDPATWTAESLASVRLPPQMFRTESFADAVPMLLEKGDRSSAMWAARLTVALEDAKTGEALTDCVLAS